MSNPYTPGTSAFIEEAIALAEAATAGPNLLVTAVDQSRSCLPMGIMMASRQVILAGVRLGAAAVDKCAESGDWPGRLAA